MVLLFKMCELIWVGIINKSINSDNGSEAGVHKKHFLEQKSFQQKKTLLNTLLDPRILKFLLFFKNNCRFSSETKSYKNLVQNLYSKFKIIHRTSIKVFLVN